MAKPEWGRKRSCPSCGTRFYDLRKDPIVCPSCGEQVEPDAAGKAKRSRAVGKEDAGARKKAAPAAAAAVDPAEVDGEAEVGAESEGEDYAEEEAVDEADELGEDDLPGVGGGDDEDQT